MQALQEGTYELHSLSRYQVALRKEVCVLVTPCLIPSPMKGFSTESYQSSEC